MTSFADRVQGIALQLVKQAPEDIGKMITYVGVGLGEQGQVCLTLLSGEYDAPPYVDVGVRLIMERLAYQLGGRLENFSSETDSEEEENPETGDNMENEFTRYMGEIKL